MSTQAINGLAGEVVMPLEDVALYHDSRVREIDRQVRESWSELAAICTQVKDRQEWKLLPSRPSLDVNGNPQAVPYHSFDDWLADAAPVCRSTIYTGMGVLSVLAADVAPADLAGMEIGNAKMLVGVSSSVRQDPEVIEAAKGGRHTRKLRDIVRAKYPDQLIEETHVLKVAFEMSAWENTVAPEIEAYRAENEDPGMSLAAVIEGMCIERRLTRSLEKGLA